MKLDNQNIKEIAEHYSMVSQRTLIVPDKYDKSEVTKHSQIRYTRYRSNIKQIDKMRDGRVDPTITRLVSYQAPLQKELVYAQVQHYAAMPWRLRLGIDFRMDTNLTTLDVYSGRWAIDTLIRKINNSIGTGKGRIPIYGCMEVGEERNQFHAHLLLTIVPQQFVISNFWKEYGSVGEVLDLQTATDRDRAIGYVVVRELQYSIVDERQGTSYAEDLIIKRHRYKH